MLHKTKVSFLVALMPDAPYNLQAIALSPTAIKVKWSPPVNTHGPIITFKVSTSLLLMSLTS